MSEPGFDDLTGLWNERDAGDEPVPERFARRARLRGRLLGYLDLALAVLVIGGTLFFVLIKPSPPMVAAGFLMLLMTLWVNWRRRRLRQMERTLHTSDRMSFLDISVQNARSDRRRANFSLWSFPTFVVVGVLFKVLARNGGHLEHPLLGVLAWAASVHGVASLLVLSIFYAGIVRSRIRAARELRRLDELRRAFELEAERDRAEGE